MKTDRRTFICGAIGAALLPAGCAIGPSIRADREGDVLTVSLASWPEAQDVVLARPREGAPTVMVRDGDEIRAFSSVCTHQGCIVRVQEQHLQCPCHGAMFDFEGRVQRGPAKKDLPELSVTVSGDEIRVQLQPLVP